MDATCQNLAFKTSNLPNWQCDFEHENLKVFKSNEHTRNNYSVNCEESFFTINNEKLNAFDEDNCYLNLSYVNVWLFQKETQFLYFDASKQISK